jgi:dienelactone hydrolase
MTHIVIFHSALGLRPGVHGFADHLRAAGHTVHLPDFYDGNVYDDLDAGIAYRDQLGLAEIAQRAQNAVADLPAELVYVGFSLGAGPAQMLAQTRRGARGALLLHGALPSLAFGVPWPAAVPMEVHAMRDDAWVDIPTATALADESPAGRLHLYPGSAHLFDDPDLPDHDPAASALMRKRILGFLQRFWCHVT